MPGGVSVKNRRFFLPVIVLLLYGFLGILVTWPLIPQLGSHIPGKLGDAYAHLWTFSWIKTALLSGQSPYFTSQLYYPEGAILFNHNIAWVHIAAWLPMQAVFGPGASYSFVHWLAFPLNGFALYLLARQHSLSVPAAFVAGLVAAFWPYNLSHFDHPNLIFICWLPLALLFLGKTITNRRLRDALFAGLFIALLGITRWQLLIMASFMIALYIAYMLLANREAWKQSVPLLAISAILALLLMSPLLYPILDYQLSREVVTDVLVGDELPYSTDLAAFFMPNRYHPIWGRAAAVASRPFSGINIYSRSLGYAVLVLSIIGIIKRFRQSWFWLLSAVVYILLALGPRLHLFGIPYFSLPYDLIDDMMLMQLVRFPDRYNVMLGIPVAMLAGYGVTVLTANRSRNQVYLRTGLISGLILFEYAMSFLMLPLHTPYWYETIAADPDQYAVLDIPISFESNDTYFNYYQLTHGKPLVLGHVSRPSREMLEFINDNPFLKTVSGTKSPPKDFVDVRNHLRTLEQADVRYLVLHKDMLNEKQLRSWIDWLAVPALYDDNDVAVFDTQTKIIGLDIPWQHAMSSGIDGSGVIGLLRANIDDSKISAGNFLELNAVWGTTGLIDRDLDVCLKITEVNGDLSDIGCSNIAEEYPTSGWIANDMVHGKHFLDISPFQPAGMYTLSLSLLRAGEPFGTIADVGEIEIKPLTREFEVPPLSNETTASWQDEIALIGYDSSSSDDALDLTLYWQALERVDPSYKIFIHLSDSSDGHVVAQIDAIPRDWTYPTNWWEQGEVVTDHYSIPLADVPPGELAVSVGIYDPATNERLLLSTENTSTPSGTVFTLETFVP